MMGTRNFTREEAIDVVEAIERVGGRGSIFGPMASGSYGVSIGRLPDVGAFLRCCAALGFSARLAYNAGSGWHIAEGKSGTSGGDED
jgi:hypothetical protein